MAKTPPPPPPSVEVVIAQARASLGDTLLRLVLWRALKERKARAGVGTRVRTSRGSKAKGRRGVVETREWLLRTFPQLEPDDVLIQTTSVGGQDVSLSPKAQRLFPFAIESKVVESLNIWRALLQAEANAAKKNLRPVVFFRRSHSRHYIAFALDDFTEVFLGTTRRGEALPEA